MVENNERTLNDLEKQISRLGITITSLNFENDIFKLFLRKEYTDLKNYEKLRIILSHAENDIIQWHREKYEGEDLETIDFEKWKNNLLKHFEKGTSMLDFLKEKKKNNETFVEY